MYVKWTSVEQFQRAKTKGGVGYKGSEDMSNKGEHFDEELNMDLLKVSEQGLPSIILQSYLTLLQKFLTITEQAFFDEMKGKEDMVLANVKASPQWRIGETSWFLAKTSLIHYS